MPLDPAVSLTNFQQDVALLSLAQSNNQGKEPPRAKWHLQQAVVSRYFQSERRFWCLRSLRRGLRGGNRYDEGQQSEHQQQDPNDGKVLHTESPIRIQRFKCDLEPKE